MTIGQHEGVVITFDHPARRTPPPLPNPARAPALLRQRLQKRLRGRRLPYTARQERSNLPPIITIPRRLARFRSFGPPILRTKFPRSRNEPHEGGSRAFHLAAPDRKDGNWRMAVRARGNDP